MTWICQIIMACGDIGMAVLILVIAVGFFALMSLLDRWIFGGDDNG